MTSIVIGEPFACGLCGRTDFEAVSAICDECDEAIPPCPCGAEVSFRESIKYGDDYGVECECALSTSAHGDPKGALAEWKAITASVKALREAR